MKTPLIYGFALELLWPAGQLIADNARLPSQPRPPMLAPEEELQQFELPPGYRLELVVSEPTIKEPFPAVAELDRSE